MTKRPSHGALRPTTTLTTGVGPSVPQTTTAAPFQVMPPLSPEEYQALRADIAAHGVRVPIDADEHGAVLDGHHRQAIAAELGIPCPTRLVAGLDEAGKRGHAFTVNLVRRQLGPISWADAFRRLAADRGVELNGSHNRHTPRAATVAALAHEVGVKPRTARHRLGIADQLAGHPALAAKVDRGEMDAKRAQRVIREMATEARRADPVDPRTVAGLVDLRHGDFRQVLDDIEPGTVDVVFTDPPYPGEYLPLWTDLAEHAARWLKPGGLLVAYTGHHHLPEVMTRLGAHLRYVWIGAVIHRGPNTQSHAYRIRAWHKPLLWYANGAYRPWAGWAPDTVYSPAPEKTGHLWQQSLRPAVELLDKLSVAGDLVVDPFLGAGTTAVACRELGRRFVGCDVDPAAVQTARERLRNGEAV